MSAITHDYETVFILSTKLGEESTQALIQKFKNLIEANGTISEVDEWGKRRLAYPINKETEGYYTLISFTSTADFIAELERIYKITDGVIRSLVVKKEPVKAKAVKKAAPAPAVAEEPAAE